MALVHNFTRMATLAIALLVTACTQLPQPTSQASTSVAPFLQLCTTALQAQKITQLEPVGKAIVTQGYAILSFQASATSIALSTATAQAGQLCIVNTRQHTAEITAIDALRYVSIRP